VNDIKTSVKKSVVYQADEKARKFMDKNENQPTVHTSPNAPKHKI
jgi:hypothetical protein